MKFILADRWRGAVSVTVLVVLAVTLAVSMPGKQAQTAPFALCDTYGILFQYPGGTNTQIHHIDMVTGADTQPAGSPIANRTINAAGYNVKDRFLYGWDHTQETLVRIHDDHTAENLSISGYSHVGGHQIIIGDVDDNGHYWFINSSNNNWYQVDLTATTPTLVASGSAAGPTGSAGADWAWVPGTNNLYRTMDDGAGPNTVTLWAFNRTSKTWSSLGVLSGITGTSRTIGANYADADGFLYSSSNSTGEIWRTNVSTQATALFSTGPSSSSNDGARCAQAIIPIDFGDAPAAYGTLLTNDGPRHSVPSYNAANNTAPLMLGNKIDVETDGFPGAQATGDDDDDIDDERGVTHIVATPGTPTALKIPVTVTNTSSSGATLAGWIDLDNDSSFEAGELITTTIPADSGTAVYELSFPSTTFTSNSYARFRLFSGTVGSPLPTGSATAGEVEDVLVQVGTFSTSKTANPPEGTTVKSGEKVTYTLTITNTGATNLTNLKIDDDLSDVLDDSTLVGIPTVSPASAGTATVQGNTLEFTGDVSAGQSVKVTYTVQIEYLGSLGNGALGNTILAAHSNCHPTVSGGTATVDDPACNTSHPVLGLAATGMNVWMVLGMASGLVAVSTILVWIHSRRSSSKTASSS